ncbi:hypothetical protein ACF08M_15945 [Streptomyces sp. NPDC015032]|uniref:hypothetical protein n=1 Tax=Streptomyces sp. NPDC015032 TaxID=3364937 RepID=UPI0037028851
MNVLAVMPALSEALANDAASVLRRRAAVAQAKSETAGGRPAVGYVYAMCCAGADRLPTAGDDGGTEAR